MRYVATALAAVLYAIGWIAGKVHVTWRWIWSALAVGWDDAHRVSTPTPSSVPTTEVPAWPAERPVEAA